MHPQFWTEDIDYSGKRVVVIGSGATAVTLIPALARRAGHVTMLQRSPSYIISLPAVDPIAGLLGHVLPKRLVYPIVRWKNVMLTLAIYNFSRRRPAAMKRLIRKLLERRLPPGFDIDTHFNPRYEPWDQRMCLVPDGDLFDAISDGRASVVTDRIETLTETVRPRVRVRARSRPDRYRHRAQDGAVRRNPPQRRPKRRDLGATLAYRGMQIRGVPNMAFAFGYTNQSWTLGPSAHASRSTSCWSTWTGGGTRPAPRATGIPRSPARRSPISPRATYVGRSMAPKAGSDPWHASRTTHATAGRCGTPESTIPRSSSPGRSDRRRDDGDRRLKHRPGVEASSAGFVAGMLVRLPS